MEQKYEVPDYVLIGLTEVQQNNCNMFMSKNVLQELLRLKYYGAIVWLVNNDQGEMIFSKNRYIQAILELIDINDMADQLTNN